MYKRWRMEYRDISSMSFWRRMVILLLATTPQKQYFVQLSMRVR